MRRLILALAVLACVAVPTAALATGENPPAPPTTLTTPAPPPATPCPCCQDLSARIDQLELVFNQKLASLQSQIEAMKVTIANQQNQINQANLRIDTIINSPPLSCRSGRIYSYSLRRSIDGSPIVKVYKVEARGSEQYATVERLTDPLTTGALQAGRFRVTANFVGLQVPNGQLRTVTAYVRTQDGKKHRLKQFVRLCLDRDGNPNDRPAQDRSGR